MLSIHCVSFCYRRSDNDSDERECNLKAQHTNITSYCSPVAAAIGRSPGNVVTENYTLKKQHKMNRIGSENIIIGFHPDKHVTGDFLPSVH